MAPGRFRSLAATTSLVALVCAVATPVTPAGALASWGGRVFESDRGAPREGVFVSLTADAGERAVQLRSEPTRTDGAFTFDDAPAGMYTLHVETPEGVFVSAEPLELRPGSNAPLALTLGPPQAKQEHGLGDGQVSRRTEFIYAGVITIVALFVYYQITEDDSEQAGSVF